MRGARLGTAAVMAGAMVGLTACGGPVQLQEAASPLSSSQVSGPATPGQPAQPTPTVSAHPISAPTSYRAKTWSFKPDPNLGGSGSQLDVPADWAETVRDTYWSDFLDPSGQVRLRTDVTAGLTGGMSRGTPKDAASAELNRLQAAAGFKLVSRRDLAASSTDGYPGAEIIYQFTRGGQVVQATFRFVGADIPMATLGIYYPPDQQQVAEGVLAKTQDSLRFAG